MKEKYYASDLFGIKKEDMPAFHFTEVLKAQYFPKVTSNISL
jgi:hypothetical protein